jgi:LytS/YehU family sensor histidine kinase
MIKCDPEKAYQMIYDFSNYLSYNFNALEDVPLVPFSEELKHIQAYTAIESERFFDRLQVRYEIETDQFTVPPLSVQPFVENAIKHGICKKMEGGTVFVRSYTKDEFYMVEITDDGVGFDVATLKKRGCRN